MGDGLYGWNSLEEMERETTSSGGYRYPVNSLEKSAHEKAQSFQNSGLFTEWKSQTGQNTSTAADSHPKVASSPQRSCDCLAQCF